MGLLLAVLAIGLYSYHTLDRERLENEVAMLDTIRVYKMSNGSLLAEKRSLETDKATLRELLDISKSELKEMEKKVGKVKTIYKIDTQVETDTLVMYHNTTDTLYKSYAFKDDYLDLYVRDSTFKLNMNVPLTIGQSKNKIFVNTSNPYVKFNNITGGNVRQSRFNFGVYAGYGITYHNGFVMGPQMGLGITYKF